ncbi:hypothetical protein Pst134EA_009378 [Puccinia striiformis f. sp. tritici]|uniref:hypothetical protein n=1 Tax=Puccinia striiformis f. sp. tritici TaxID=168172 RepID=UPI0020077ABE|nr:hypothetical protein Pst134EA_009378 [Puccinia striiformis f. sp. tritici]KAH9468849.1 hypothetical protein Pst134EA_009378 [Puccinia striiformis f. sp. tritici]
MSQQQRISHHMYTQGPFDVIEDATHNLKDNNNYGIFTNAASIVVNNLPLDGVQQGQSLQHQRSTYLTNTGSLLLNKINVHGFSTITKLDKVRVQYPNKPSQTDLCVTLQHSDYNNSSRDSILFKTVYIVPGNKILGKTHSLFELGAVVIMVGHMSGYLDKVTTWEVQEAVPSLAQCWLRLHPWEVVTMRQVTALQTTPTNPCQSTSKAPSSLPRVFPTPSSPTSQRPPTPEIAEESEEEGEAKKIKASALTLFPTLPPTPLATSDAPTIQSTQTARAIGTKKAKDLAAKLQEDKKCKDDMLAVHPDLDNQTKSQNTILADQREALTTLANNSIMQTDLATVSETSRPSTSGNK